MQNHILSELDVMCPLKSFRIRISKDPWITNELVERIRDKDRLLSKAKRTKRPEDWKRAKRERNIIIKDVKKAKTEYLIDLQNSHSGDRERVSNREGAK